jgi:hypothetical protein
MRALLQLLAESLWPIHATPRAGRGSADLYLKPLIFVAIVLLVGPDLFAFVELTTLLDLYGATLFLFAFMVGFEVLGMNALQRLRRVVVPDECATLFGTRVPSAVGLGVTLVAQNALILFLVGFMPFYALWHVLALRV